ncbi:MAG: D-aminoacyl-tRNA deacylase [Oscillospiraceae bacterium]|nr:D-aminoacyl-tRNA deacylase [Oscillospiraceae bacterium]
MKVVLQRVSSSSVRVDGVVCGEIGHGYLVLLGINEGDDRAKIEKMVEKIQRLRIFSDENGKTNLSIGDVGGGILVVSQFTLCADCRKGNRPSFINAAAPALAEELYEYFVEYARDKFVKVEHGVFGASMKVELVNEGPFTVVLED